MKQIIYILSLLFIASCKQSNLEERATKVTDTILTKNNLKKPKKGKQNKYLEKQSLSGFEKETLYALTDTITADFNGDGIIDKAFYKKENGTSGIIIKHGQTDEEFRIGFGDKFSTWTDGFDCDWVDYWGLVEDKETSETTFTEDGDVSGNKEVSLQNPSIVLGKDEVGGGLITFLNGKYIWIHQTC
jgi:hypothetical protein